MTDMQKGECLFFIEDSPLRIGDLPLRTEFVSWPLPHNPGSRWGDLGSDNVRCSTLAAKIVKAATRLDAMGEYDDAIKEKKAELVFVIATGGHIFIHSVTEVLKAGIHVELWAWESAMASYKHLHAIYPSLLSLNSLIERPRRFGVAGGYRGHASASMGSA
jgi:hypothetical protein